MRVLLDTTHEDKIDLETHKFFCLRFGEKQTATLINFSRENNLDKISMNNLYTIKAGLFIDIVEEMNRYFGYPKIFKDKKMLMNQKSKELGELMDEFFWKIKALEGEIEFKVEENVRK